MAFARAMRVELAELGLSFGQFVHLDRLWNKDGITQVELSYLVGVEVASSTGVLNELEALGWIQRQRSKDDRRKVLVHLTVEGRALSVPVLERVRAINFKARHGISEKDVALAFRVLLAVAANVSTAYPAGSPRTHGH
jgi:DNA-binding MarR family transcriptional regulator